ncbi:MAG: GNAT family N-acetyltransferase [Chitinophagaceae bacterium]
MENYKLRKGTQKDALDIFRLIEELATFQGNADKVKMTLSQIEKDGWGKQPAFETTVAEDQHNNVVGLALYYVSYSTWTGRCLYLEDLIVSQNQRRKGLGKILFTHLLEEAKLRNFKGLCWQVLDTNTMAIEFYKKFDASLENNWYNGKIIF